MALPYQLAPFRHKQEYVDGRDPPSPRLCRARNSPGRDAFATYELDWNGGVQVDTAINVYTGQFFDHLGTITLPRAWRNEGWHRFGGVFGAFDAAGEHFHVIMRTDIGDGGTMWAVTTISAEDPQ